MFGTFFKNMVTQVNGEDKLDQSDALLKLFEDESSEHRYPEILNSRFGLKVFPDSNKQLHIDVKSACVKSSSQQQEAMRVSKVINQILHNERHINKMCTSRAILQELSTVSPILQSGSLADGFSTARWFGRNEAWEIETDIMYVLGIYPKEASGMFVNSSTQSGYCHLRVSHVTHRDCINPLFFEKAHNIFGGDQSHVDSLLFQVNALEFIDENNPKDSSVSQNLFKAVSVIPVIDQRRLLKVEPTSSKRGHVAGTVTCVLPAVLMVAASIDHVPCLKLNFWPDVASEWLTRQSKWPTKEQREGIASSGCHIVPKSSDLHKHDSTWRYSFSLAEHHLMQLLSPGQRQSYYLFKVLYYKYIKEIGQNEEDSIFHSYLFKTCMFWICEQYPPNHDIWRAEKLFESVEVLLGLFKENLCSRNLWNFFIRSYNLIENISEGLLDEAAKVVNNIRKQLRFYVPFNINEMVSFSSNPMLVWELVMALTLAANQPMTVKNSEEQEHSESACLHQGIKTP